MLLKRRLQYKTDPEKTPKNCVIFSIFDIENKVGLKSFSIYSGESSFVKSGQIKYPVRFGHEWSGVVESVGEDVKHFKPGDRVLSDSGISCGECDECKKHYDIVTGQGYLWELRKK